MLVRGRNRYGGCISSLGDNVHLLIGIAIILQAVQRVRKVLFESIACEATDIYTEVFYWPCALASLRAAWRGNGSLLYVS